MLTEITIGFFVFALVTVRVLTHRGATTGLDTLIEAASNFSPSDTPQRGAEFPALDARSKHDVRFCPVANSLRTLSIPRSAPRCGVWDFEFASSSKTIAGAPQIEMVRRFFLITNSWLNSAEGEA